MRSETAAKLEQYARTTNQDGARSAPPSPERQVQPEQDLGPQSPPAPTTQDILTAITTCQSTLTATLTAKIEEVKVELSLLKQDVQNIRDRTRAIEERVSTLEDCTTPLPNEITQLHKLIKQATERMEDMENRQRRSNIRVVGLPERSEGQNPELFAEKWLQDMLGAEIFSKQLVAERAHRVPTRAPPPGAPLRPFLIKLLNYRDRDAALQAARKKGDIQFQGVRVSLYPDYSAALQRQRGTFYGVKKRLRDLGINYNMLFPAKLRIMEGGKVHIFDQPAGAESWIDSRPAPSRHSPQRASPPRSPQPPDAQNKP
ncbi:hypothetical protein XENTR_v10021959 [Xenopus tropicalis]|nr:hypothetical protein XENTR_v10021959 [Xenopus tropicalis]